jgi:hypothetical protein
VIPADHKWVARAIVARILHDTIDDLGVKYPVVGPEKKKALAVARKKLMAE